MYNGKINEMIGNAAAMYKALKEIRDRLVYLYGHTDGTFNPPALKEVYEIANTALAKPPRNCDVGSVEEQTMRMRAHCNRRKPDCKDSLGNRCKCYGDVSKENCFLKWAQMPYKGGNDGIK